jgi:hypothetical protein
MHDCREVNLPPIGSSYARNGIRRVSSRALAIPPQTLVRYPTSIVERFLLMMTIVLLPLETYFPTIAGFTVNYILFIILTGYVMLNRPYLVARAWFQPLFVSAYAMLILIFLIELSHPYPNIYHIFRFGQVIASAMFVSVLCRDRAALQSAVYGYLIAGLWMSILLFLTSYGVLSVATTTDFGEASRLRGEVFGGNTLQANPNFMAFVAECNRHAGIWNQTYEDSDAGGYPWDRYAHVGS